MEEKYEPIELNLHNFDMVRLVKDRKTEELLAVKYIERGETVHDNLDCCFSLIFITLLENIFFLLLLFS